MNRFSHAFSDDGFYFTQTSADTKYSQGLIYRSEGCCFVRFGIYRIFQALKTQFSCIDALNLRVGTVA